MNGYKDVLGNEFRETQKPPKEEMLNVRPKLFYIRNQINLECSDWAQPLQFCSALQQRDAVLLEMAGEASV